MEGTTMAQNFTIIASLDCYTSPKHPRCHSVRGFLLGLGAIRQRIDTISNINEAIAAAQAFFMCMFIVLIVLAGYLGTPYVMKASMSVGLTSTIEGQLRVAVPYNLLLIMAALAVVALFDMYRASYRKKKQFYVAMRADIEALRNGVRGQIDIPLWCSRKYVDVCNACTEHGKKYAFSSFDMLFS